MPFGRGCPVCDGAGPAERPVALARDLRRFLAGVTAIFGLVLAAGAMLLAQG